MESIIFWKKYDISYCQFKNQDERSKRSLLVNISGIPGRDLKKTLCLLCSIREGEIPLKRFFSCFTCQGSGLVSKIKGRQKVLR